MISHRLQSVPVTGYYQYISQVRHRVNVAPSKEIDSIETTTTTVPSATMGINNNNQESIINSSSTDNVELLSSDLTDNDVTQWSSTQVQHWIEEQCQNFELKKATTAKFQMNGQALVLLTKHDFLRRSPDGGEILYYALQRIINPNKFNPGRTNQDSIKNDSDRQNPRIVEVGSDTDDHNSVTSSTTSAKPIVEEPDDPPLLRNQESDKAYENHQNRSQSFIYNNSGTRQTIYTIPAAAAAAAAAYYQQQQAYPNGFIYTHHHVHPHMTQQQFYHPRPHPYPQFIHQYYQAMTAQGILIEVLDSEDAKHLAAHGYTLPSNETSTNGSTSDDKKQLYLVTMNGQQYIMNEEQIRRFVADVHQQQQHFQQQLHQQQQQLHQQQQQQQQLHQQQQQQFHQQQQQFRQQQQQQQQQQFRQQQQNQQQQQQQHYTYYQQPSQDNVYYTL